MSVHNQRGFISRFQKEDERPELSPDSEEFVLDQLTEFELKLQRLQGGLQGQDLAALLKEMEEEKVPSQRF